MYKRQSEFCLAPCDEGFAKRAKKAKGGFIIGGANYGQGSSREHAALVPLYLGIKAVLAKSFARIHRANLMNNGILPLEFTSDSDYDAAQQGDDIVIENVHEQIAAAVDGAPVKVRIGELTAEMKLETVSYTHLDVYKRQHSFRRSSSPN